MNISEAKTRLFELLAATERGEEVIIARAGVAVVQCVPAKCRGVRLGLLAGFVAKERMPDFLEPMSEAELAEWCS